MEKITVFYSKKTKGKFPYSPFDDKTFVFETFESANNLAMYQVLVSHFILNIPINIDKPIRSFRRKANLEPYYSDKLNYFILDIDKVTSEKNKNLVLQFFEEYKVILGESTSYNGIDNFNMKGILFIEEVDFKTAKIGVSLLNRQLKDICEIDEAVIRKGSLNAPIRKHNIFLNNEHGEKFVFEKENIKEAVNKIKIEYVGDCTKYDIADINEIKADSIETLCLKVFQSMGFEGMKNNENESISFKHPDEKKTPGGYFWFSSAPYTMHHFNSAKSINIFHSIIKLPIAKELMKKDINYDNELLKFNVKTRVMNVNERYLKITDKISENIQRFLNNSDGLFTIKSPMGTGKSTVINHIIEEAHAVDMRVLIITNRISVANDFGKKYDIKIYNKDKYNIGDSLICQYDSLWHYNIKMFDVIIMDEFISLMMHSRSNLNNSSVNMIKFFASFNKKLVIADAFLTGYENFILNNKKDNMFMIDNNYRDSTDLYDYENYNYFVDSLIFHANNNKITISATSLAFINSLKLLLENRGLKVIALTAATHENTKKLIYDLFEKNDHDKWDVLIYSPTLTVGVSNLNDVNYHFHYDSSMSTDSISSIQMIKRTRKAKEIHMFIKERTNYNLKTSYNDIRDEYMGNIGRNIEHNYLFDIDNYGESKLSYIGKKAIKIDVYKNILEFNHKASIKWLLKYHFLKEPEIIDNTYSSDVLHHYKKQIKNDQESIVLSNINQFLSLNDLEKTEILENSKSDNVMKVLAEIDENLMENTPLPDKSKILEIILKDKFFIKKSRYYKIMYNFNTKIWDVPHIKSLVSTAIIKNKNDDLDFYNLLLKYKQCTIRDEYSPSEINKEKKLKKILDKCGYHISRENTCDRLYVIDKNIKKYYKYIK